MTTEPWERAEEVIEMKKLLERNARLVAALEDCREYLQGDNRWTRDGMIDKIIEALQQSTEKP